MTNEYLAAENRILRAQMKGRFAVIRCRKSYFGSDRPPARTKSLGRIGGCREAGYAAGLVPKAHRHKFDGSHACLTGSERETFWRC